MSVLSKRVSVAWIVPSVGVALLVAIVLRLIANPWLSAAGFDPVFGFLLSPNPYLRAIAIVQAVGAACASTGAVLTFLWYRKRRDPDPGR